MKDEDILKQAKEQYKESSQAFQHIYDQARDDMRFLYDIDSGQWPENVRRERLEAGRPIITCNKLQKFVRQMRGDMMQNRPRIKVIPVDNNADVVTATLYDGIIRQIEYLSDAPVAYDTAYMNSVSSSVGYFMIDTYYAEDDSFDQDIKVVRIQDPTSVYFDPKAEHFTYNDAGYCFIEKILTKDEFKRQFPDAEIMDFDGNRELFGEWLSNDNVRVAQYFYKEPIEKKIVQLETGEIIELSKGITIQKIKDAGGIIKRERKVDSYVIKRLWLNGAEVLQSTEWPGKYIPVIPVFGDEVVSGGRKHYLSAIRGAKGPQMMYNYWSTAATENVALTPKSPFIVDHRQVKGFEEEWARANIRNTTYLRYNHVQGIPKPQREVQLQVPNAIVQMMQTTAFDIEDNLGRYESSKGEASNERSGKAIMARVAQSDKGTYTYMENLTRAIVYAGRQLIDLIPKIYDTQRALQIMDEAGNQQIVEVNKAALGPQGQPGRINDLSVGKYDLVATVGASYSTKRDEMTRMLIESMQYAPDLAPVIAPLVFKYADYPGAQEIYAELMKRIQQQQQVQVTQQQTAAPRQTKRKRKS